MIKEVDSFFKASILSKTAIGTMAAMKNRVMDLVVKVHSTDE
jgi:hypothetical protein